MDSRRPSALSSWAQGRGFTGSHCLAQAPWTHQFDPLDGFMLHECAAGEILAKG
jgi:hypothetical protein